MKKKLLKNLHAATAPETAPATAAITTSNGTKRPLEDEKEADAKKKKLDVSTEGSETATNGNSPGAAPGTTTKEESGKTENGKSYQPTIELKPMETETDVEMKDAPIVEAAKQEKSESSEAPVRKIEEDEDYDVDDSEVAKTEEITTAKPETSVPETAVPEDTTTATNSISAPTDDKKETETNGSAAAPVSEAAKKPENGSSVSDSAEAEAEKKPEESKEVAKEEPKESETTK
ncbi:unnamed protein product [[Candida] boidinii]|nr:unnamed protein product [[Candida] boidinii]